MTADGGDAKIEPRGFSREGLPKTIPPFWFLVSIVIQVLLHRLVPARELFGLPWDLAGLPLVLAGMAIAVSASRQFTAAGTPIRCRPDSSVATKASPPVAFAISVESAVVESFVAIEAPGHTTGGGADCAGSAVTLSEDPGIGPSTSFCAVRTRGASDASLVSSGTMASERDSWLSRQLARSLGTSVTL